MNDGQLYATYVNSILTSWLGSHLGTSITQILELLYDNGFLVDRLVTAITGSGPPPFKDITGVCTDVDDIKYKFVAYMERIKPYCYEVWELKEVSMELL